MDPREWDRAGVIPHFFPRVAAALGTGLAGAGATALVSPFMRALTSPAERARAVYRRAVKAFLGQKLFDTRDRTGILLFVSLHEHRIEVLADRGIDEQVDAAAWTVVTDHITAGSRPTDSPGVFSTASSAAVAWSTIMGWRPGPTIRTSSPIISDRRTSSPPRDDRPRLQLTAVLMAAPPLLYRSRRLGAVLCGMPLVGGLLVPSVHVQPSSSSPKRPLADTIQEEASSSWS